MDNNKIGENIATLRKQKNLTQQELGNKLYVTDKAVSKWERGLSLPDITLLEKLAQVLDTDIYSILQIENQTNLNLEEILQKEKKKIQKQTFKNIFLFILPFLFLIFIVLFKIFPFGYDTPPISYLHNTQKFIYLGIPKFSFYLKNTEDSYSLKSFRSKSVLTSETKAYLNTLTPISCNNTTYYYDNDTNSSIIDYDIKGNIFYNTISYSIKNGNYCHSLEIKNYKEKLNNLSNYILYSESSYLQIYFRPTLTTSNNENEWSLSLFVFYNNGQTSKVLERSSGNFEIKNNELIYYRTTITEDDETIDIPAISKFTFKNNKLILEENYLKKYEDFIVLTSATIKGDN